MLLAAREELLTFSHRENLWILYKADSYVNQVYKCSSHLFGMWSSVLSMNGLEIGVHGDLIR
jgi:hypothetical protein